jgi:Family of unknown function (DUF5677)
MQPRPPDPTAAALNLQRIPGRVQKLSNAFRKANQDAKRFPDWREYQILAFIRYSGLYAADLNETYRTNRIDSLAQAMRNLMELNIWTQYCGGSEKNAKQFFDDAARDMKDMMEAIQKLYTTVNKEPEKKLQSMLVHLRNSATKFNVENYDADYTRLSDAAEKVGKKYVHSPIYKVASKFAHPTALLLILNQPLQDVQDSLYEGGAKLAVVCLGETEKCIKRKYPELRL